MATPAKSQAIAPRGRPARSAEAADAVRAAILAAAERLFTSAGYEGVSVRNVAKEDGCSPAALYRLFPHKRALLRNIWEDALGLFDLSLEQATTAVTGPLERLRLLGRAYVNFWVAHPDHFRALFLIEDRLVDPGERYFADTSPSLARLVRRFQATTEAAIAAGVLDGDPREVVELIFCALHGVSSGLIGMPEYDWGPPAELAGRMTDTLLDGLAQA
ncbi:MAG TPA: TetR/AcrR family transcriptional regulator [Caulobacteraceae bacterium]|nr:TetR/AcrR family transcriptional regulator [Caulobacteraceae bacterium]